MKKIFQWITASIAVLLVLSACTTTYEPFEGRVDDKDTYRWSSQSYPCGNPASCAPISTWHTGYRLMVSNQIESSRWRVKKSVYEACNPGDRVSRTEDGTVSCY